jgi:hypothetical protein
MLYTWFKEWKKDILEHKYKILLALLFLAISITATALSSSYVDEVRTVAVPDLVLDSLPVVNLSFIFNWGLLLMYTVYFAYPLIYKPKKFHYALGLMSLFLLTRSAFMILTHLKVPMDAINVADYGVIHFFTYSNDLFFSGHTGAPFLGFLVYDNKKIKYFMLAMSIILAITVLLMHVHYSIDVASAYFITYGIYKIGDKLFGG